MKKILLFGLCMVFLLACVTMIAAVPVCEFDFVIGKDDEVDFTSHRGFESFDIYEPELNFSEYELNITDFENQTLIDVLVPAVFFITDPWVEVEEAPVSIRLLCDEEWSELNILYNESPIFTENIEGIFCDHNGTCDGIENHIICPDDCPSSAADGWCERKLDAICDPDCIDGDYDCTTEAAKSSSTAYDEDILFNNFKECNHNGVCDFIENAKNCPDCKEDEKSNFVPVKKEEEIVEVSDVVIEDEYTEEEIGQIEDNTLLYASLIILLLLALLLVYKEYRNHRLREKRRKKKEEEQQWKQHQEKMQQEQMEHATKRHVRLVHAPPHKGSAEHHKMHLKAHLKEKKKKYSREDLKALLHKTKEKMRRGELFR